MTALNDILDLSCVEIDVDASSKKRAIERGSELIADAHIGVNPRALFEQLMARERLGSTGLGDGIAIPHCRSDAVTEIVGGLLRLAQPINFDAPDDDDVDLIFCLVVPKDAQDMHLKILSRLARIFSEATNRDTLRAAPTAQALFDAFDAMLRSAGGSD